MPTEMIVMATDSGFTFWYKTFNEKSLFYVYLQLVNKISRCFFWKIKLAMIYMK